MKDSNAKLDAAIVAHLVKNPSLFRRFVAPIADMGARGNLVGDGMRSIHRALELATLADKGGCAVNGNTAAEDTIYECRARLEILIEISDAIARASNVDAEREDDFADAAE